MSWAEVDRIIKKIVPKVDSLQKEMTESFAAIFGGKKTFTSNGTFIVPPFVNKIEVFAAGGGGGGGRGGAGGYEGGGGGGGDCIRKVFEVFPGQEIRISLGVGGAGATSFVTAKDGSPTVIGDLMTVPGGGHGFNLRGDGGAAGGTGAGKGGRYNEAGADSPFAKGGTSGSRTGGGGGASFGNGGNGLKNGKGGNGSYGGGGAGGGENSNGGDGGKGFASITWGKVANL